MMHSSLRCFLILIVAMAVVGCGETADIGEAPTPVARRAAKSLADAVTEDEVRTFLDVLHSLPNNAAPQFTPLPMVTAHEDMSADTLRDLYRQEFRAMFDPARHGEQWRKDPQLMSTFQKHDVEPEDFAALMIRLSCAIGAGAMSPTVDLPEAAATADAKIAHLVQAIRQLEVTPLPSSNREQRRQALDSLQHLVAFSEFARLLSSVPAESRVVVSRHRDVLEPYLPRAGNPANFERKIETTVVPVNFEQPAKQ